MATASVNIQLDGTTPPDQQPHAQDEWFKSLPRPGPNVSRPIRWFPRELRRNDENKECYEPLAISIGPYHQKKRHLEPMQNMKALYASKYIQSKRSTFGHLYGKVERVAGEARNCYAEDATLDMSDLDFTRMMFLDGCFILQFISHEVDQGRTMPSVWQDLLLLDNQLPFIILMELEGPEEYNNLITKMEMFFQIVVVYTPEQGTHSSPSPQPIHLHHFLQAYLTGNMVRRPERGDDEHWHRHTFRSVEELKKAGIDFRASRSHRFSNVRFISGKIWGGELELPAMFIHGGTKSILLNLVAFEMCYQDMLTTETPDVASYICFLDHLIDRPGDVKELRSKGILKNFTGGG